MASVVALLADDDAVSCPNESVADFMLAVGQPLLFPSDEIFFLRTVPEQLVFDMQSPFYLGPD